MSKFEDISSAKLSFERGDDSAQLKINLADVTRNEIRAMNQLMHCQDKDGILPRCDIDVDFDHHPGRAAKLIHALERRGFDVDIDRENKTIEITKDFKGGQGDDGCGDAAPGAKVLVNREFGPHIEIGRAHLGHDHFNRFGWRERAILHAVKDA